MRLRVSKRQGVSLRTGKLLKETLFTSVRDHWLECDHKASWDEFTILGRESNHRILEIKESFFLLKEKKHYLTKVFTLSSYFHSRFIMSVIEI